MDPPTNNPSTGGGAGDEFTTEPEMKPVVGSVAGTIGSPRQPIEQLDLSSEISTKPQTFPNDPSSSSYQQNPYEEQGNSGGGDALMLNDSLENSQGDRDEGDLFGMGVEEEMFTGQQQLHEQQDPNLQLIDNDLQTFFAEKATLEQTNFNLNEELCRVKEMLNQLDARNAELQSQVSISAAEISERTRLLRQMESARNDIADQKITLDASYQRLKCDNQEREQSIKTLVKEKQQLATEIVSLRDELKQVVNEKAFLKLEKANMEQERRTLQFEREKAQSDKDMYQESKRWFIQELSERDNKVSQLRIEMSGKELSWQNERMSLHDDVAKLKLQIEGLTSQIQFKETQNIEAIARFTEMDAEHRKQTEDLEAQLRNSTELANLYKENAEKSAAVAVDLHEEKEARESIIRETKQVIIEVQHEMEQERTVYKEELGRKEARITELQEELDKANILLKNTHGVRLDVTDEELSILSPAAAQTSRLLKGGQSLTSIVRDHARLAGELAEAKEANRQLELSMKELVDEIEERVPNLLHQKDVLDRTFDQNTHLQEQLTEAEEERRHLASQRDAGNRELAFTRAELEKYQRDYAGLSKQVQHLLFVLEKERSGRNSESPPLDADEDRQLFDNIGQLQKRNMQLESDLARERASAVQAALTAKNAEMERVLRDLEASKEAEERLKSELQQINTAFSLMREHADKLQELVQDSVSANEARAAKLEAEDALSQNRALQMKIARLEEVINVLKEEKKRADKAHNDRVELHQKSEMEVRTTNAKLEASFELQKQTAASTLKELENVQKQLSRMEEENRRLKTADADLTAKIHQLNTEVMEMQDESSRLKIKCHSATEEAEYNALTIKRLQAEIEGLRSSAFNDKQVMLSMNELTARLSRVEAEKLAQNDSQFEVLRMERDSLKASSARLTDHLSNAKAEFKQVQTRLEQELSHSKQQLREKEEQLLLAESQLVEARTRLATTQSNSTTSDNVMGMSPERLQKECQQLKNRCQYLENQLEELKTRLAETETELAMKKAENERVSSHSGVLETNLLRTTEMGALERQRLEARAAASESRSNDLTRTVGELREELMKKGNELNDLQISMTQEMSILQQSKDISDVHLSNARSDIDSLQTSLKLAREETDAKIAQLNTTLDELSSLNNELNNERGKVDVLNNRIMAKERELMDAEQEKKMAEDARAEAERLLATRSEEMIRLENDMRQGAEQYNSRIAEITSTYETLVASVSDRNPLEAEAVSDPESSNSVIETLRRVVSFLRTEKDKAVERLMEAEVEVKRARAEAHEVQSSRDELMKRISKLEADAAAGIDAVTERAQLMERLNVLSTAQKEAAQCRSDADRFRKAAIELQTQVKTHRIQAEQLKAALAEANVKSTQTTTELENRKKEIVLLKNRIEANEKLINTNAIAELEQVRSKLSRAETELNTANNNAIEAEKRTVEAEKKVEGLKKSLEEERTACNRMKGLARKYRDEAVAMKKEQSEKGMQTDVVQSTVSAPTSENIVNLQRQVDTLQNETINLKAQLEMARGEVSVKSNELVEVQMKQNLINSVVNKHSETIKILKEEKVLLITKIENLEKQLAEKELTMKALSASPVKALHVVSQISSAPSTSSFSSLTNRLIKPAAIEGATSSPQSTPPLSASTPKRSVFSGATSVTSSPQLGVTPQKSLATNQPPPSALDHQSSVEDMMPKIVPAASIFGGIPAATSSSSSLSNLASDIDLYQPQQSILPTSLPATVYSTPNWNASNSLSVNVSSVPSVTSSGVLNLISPGQSLFGRSAPPPVSLNLSLSASSSANSTREENLAIQPEQEAGQSSLVSGSVESEVAADDDIMQHNDSAGESRDSTAMPVSSSDGNRKRLASDREAIPSQEPKRQRESPSEAVTSSEERHGNDGRQDDNAPMEQNAGMDDFLAEGHVADGANYVEADDDDDVEVIHQNQRYDVSDEDVSEAQDFEDEEEDEEDQEDEEDDDDDDDEGDNGDEDEDGDDEDGIEIIGEERNQAMPEEILLGSSDDEVEDIEAVDEPEGVDDEVVEENEVVGSQQIALEDEDREAASAMEEADDEGRTSADGSVARAASAAPAPSDETQQQTQQQQQQPRRPPRAPITYSQEDQCSSSNETGSSSLQGPSRLLSQSLPIRRVPQGDAARGGRSVAPSPPVRGSANNTARRSRALYRANRGGRGGPYK